MLLCDHCIDYLRSRGERVFKGPLALDIDEAELAERSCEWCGEVDDLYDCRAERRNENDKGD